MRLTDPFVTFILVLAIGVIVGVLFEKYMRTAWLSKQVAGPRRVLLTSALVGIAGAFIGYHIALLATLPRGSLVPLIAAAIGAVAIVWGWRTVKL
ncbi:MAG TPA: transglycosylase [Xanthobacteraceae bacterium]|nr:transglycosylase [Xanthobacteraceae bacterium]